MNAFKTLSCAVALLLAAGAIPALAAEDGPTFDQVMAEPDNVDLNLAYAKAQANDGHLLGAAAALERILMNHPEAASVRLFYAVVLYRLDDLQGAQAQLAMLKDAKLSPLEQNEWEKYTRLVKDGRRNYAYSGFLAAGVRYQTDAFDELFSLPSYALAYAPANKDGADMVYSGDFTGSIKLDDDLSIFLTGGGYDQSHFAGPTNNLQHIDGEVGLMSTQLMTSWQIGAVEHYYRIFGFDYLTEAGAKAQASWRPDTRLTVAAQAEAAWQNYDIPYYGFSFYNGWRFTLQGGVSYRIDARSTIGGTLGYEAKNAVYNVLAYDAYFMQGHYHWLLGRGMYFDFLGEVRWAKYRAGDINFYYPSAKKRNDLNGYLRAALGVPLSAFTPAGATGDMLEDFTLEAAVSYTNRGIYDVPIAGYDSTGVQLRLIWHFDSNG